MGNLFVIALVLCFLLGLYDSLSKSKEISLEIKNVSIGKDIKDNKDTASLPKAEVDVAIEILSSIGYGKREAKKMVSEVLSENPKDVNELVKLTLAKLEN